MPFQMSTVGRDKGVHPDSYWTITDIHISPLTETGYVIFQGFHDNDEWSRPDSGSPVPIHGAEVTIPVDRTQYLALMAEYLSTPTLKIFAILESLAAQHHFFADATRVPFPFETPQPE